MTCIFHPIKLQTIVLSHLKVWKTLSFTHLGAMTFQSWCLFPTVLTLIGEMVDEATYFFQPWHANHIIGNRFFSTPDISRGLRRFDEPINGRLVHGPRPIRRFQINDGGIDELLDTLFAPHEDFLASDFHDRTLKRNGRWRRRGKTDRRREVNVDLPRNWIQEFEQNSRLIDVVVVVVVFGLIVG